MGFLNKMWNWVRGKGYQEEQPVELPPQTSTQEIEDTQYPEEEQKEQKEIQEQREEIQKTIIKPEPSASEKEVQQLKKRIKKYPTRKEIEEKIDRERTNRIQVQHTLDDIGQLRPLYTKIFTDNAKLTDPDILGILIENREKLRHRFEATFRIFDEKEQVGELRVAGILIEHTNAINNFVTIGKETDYLQQELQQALNHFEQNYGAIGGTINVSTTKKITVRDIQTDVTYA